MLATNGTMTFAILNYARIDAPTNVGNVMVGVNAGDGVNYHTHPDVGSKEIYKIENAQGNTCQPGQMVYRIDTIRNSHKGNFSSE